jgi:hypothetical protein
MPSDTLRRVLIGCPHEEDPLKYTLNPGGSGRNDFQAGFQGATPLPVRTGGSLTSCSGLQWRGALFVLTGHMRVVTRRDASHPLNHVHRALRSDARGAE